MSININILVSLNDGFWYRLIKRSIISEHIAYSKKLSSAILYVCMLYVARASGDSGVEGVEGGGFDIGSNARLVESI